MMEPRKRVSRDGAWPPAAASLGSHLHACPPGNRISETICNQTWPNISRLIGEMEMLIFLSIIVTLIGLSVLMFMPIPKDRLMRVSQRGAGAVLFGAGLSTCLLLSVA